MVANADSLREDEQDDFRRGTESVDQVFHGKRLSCIFGPRKGVWQ